MKLVTMWRPIGVMLLGFHFGVINMIGIHRFIVGKADFEQMIFGSISVIVGTAIVTFPGMMFSTLVASVVMHDCRYYIDRNTQLYLTIIGFFLGILSVAIIIGSFEYMHDSVAVGIFALAPNCSIAIGYMGVYFMIRSRGVNYLPKGD